MSDVFQLEVVGETESALAAAVALAMQLGSRLGVSPRGVRLGATHYVVRAAEPARPDSIGPEWERGSEGRPSRLALLDRTSSEAGVVALPFTLDPAGAADFVRRWLAEVEYPPQPDCDGVSERGWRVVAGSSDRELGDGGGRRVLTASPHWVEYGR